MPPAPAQRKMLRLPEVLEIARFTKTHIYRLERAGQFPKRIHLSPSRVVWDSQEIAAWIEAKMAARPAQ